MLLLLPPLPGLEVFYEEQDFRRYQSGQPTVFSGAYIITVLQYVYTWLIFQLYGRSGPTGTFGNSVPPTKPRAQASVRVSWGDMTGVKTSFGALLALAGRVHTPGWEGGRSGRGGVRR